MKQRTLSLILTVLLLACVPPGEARAGLFPAVRTYEGQFEDISETDWFYENVRALYELGLATGKGSESLFVPEGDMTVAEALTMAARLRSLYEYGSSEAGPARHSGGIWYLPYVSYLQAVGAIGGEFGGACDQPATRAQMAHILANALPQSLLEPINGEVVAACWESGGYIRDVNAGTPYYQDILKLYEWGILSGMDRTGSFHPGESIPRCQAAAMVTRLVYSELRIRLDWDASSSRADAAMPDLVESGGDFYPAPGSPQEIDADVRRMLSLGQRSITLNYPEGSLTRDAVNQLMEAFLRAIRHYVEQTYNQIHCSYSLQSGQVVFTYSSSLYEDSQLDYYREATIALAIQVRRSLWESGAITPDMSEYDKARAYFTWICENCRYDFSSEASSMSHSGYRVFTEGLAVCDGYTAAYNLLLKLEGISCTTMSTPDHIWTVAELDGTTYHIDATWGDQTNTVAYRYFGMTEADSLERFK